MPKKTKNLPDNRADWSFGAVLYWHFFIYGSRPDVHPDETIGRIWQPKDAFYAVGKSANTFWNWIDDRHLPFETANIESALFGTSKDFGEWRLELQTKLAQTRAKLAPAPKTGRALEAVEPLPADDDAVEILPPEPEEDADENTQLVVWRPTVERMEWNGDHGHSHPGESQGALTLLEAVQAYWTKREGAKTSSAKRQRNVVAIGGAAALTALVGVYVVSQRTTPAPREIQITIKEPPLTPEPIKPTPPIQEPNKPVKELSEEEKRAALEKREIEKTILANQERQQREALKQRQAAVQRDADTQAALKAQQDRDDNARRVAGAGYSLIENNSVTGTSIGLVQAESVADCARACLRDGCDAFSYFKDEAITANRKTRSCYRYREPITFYAHPGYSAGRRSDAAAVEKQSWDGARLPIILAQATTTTPPMAPDGVVQCSGGPVKVSGYNLTCDAYLGGGATLGSAQLAYTVANINECSAKCSAIKACTAFTYNSADNPGKHRCEIFGGKPESRSVSGWVSGER